MKTTRKYKPRAPKQPKEEKVVRYITPPDQPSEPPKRTIHELYAELCETPSDINELLPILREYASKCDHITEMGIRHGISTVALLSVLPKKYVGYDLDRYPEIDEIESLAKEAGIEFEFHVSDCLKVKIEVTDFLMIDTFHTATQLKLELAFHSAYVNKYIAIHDTHTYWERGQDQLAGRSNDINCGRGLKYAIEPFLAEHPEWGIAYRTEINNGLMILEMV